MILVLNCGSSSIKYQLFTAKLARVSGGTIDKIGEVGGPPSHDEALAAAITHLHLDSPDLTCVGHRVVHGGAAFVAPTLITDDVMAAIERLTPLAPLHNPPALAGISACRRFRPDIPQVAVFDTAFHATLPPAAYTYALDPHIAQRWGIRRYGFHGTSYAYVSRRTAELLNRPVDTVNSIVLHLGNGASACAVRRGHSVETSMGLTPLEGLIMGNRCGDLDPATIFHLHRVAGYSIDHIDELLNRESGLRGMCGDNDMRTIQRRRDQNDPAAALAFDAYCHRIRKYIGAYAAVLGRVDAITFTGGVGENSAPVRAAALNGLEYLGITIDAERNAADTTGPRVISPENCPVAVCVIPTDEETEIASQVRHLLRIGATK
jgi:acetate kinase